MSRRYVFSSESVGEDHPDKVCDTISDAVLDACIRQDRHSRVACETYAKSHTVIVGGEITVPNLAEDRPLETVVPISKIVRDCVRGIGYVNEDDVFHADKIVIEEMRRKVLPKEMLGEDTRLLVNPTGNFVVGGPQGDTGLTGRKIIVDSYGGMGRHGGGAFSGKDPSKVDRSAAYMGRWVAKNVVASGLAERCEVQFAYAIGHPEPVSVSIDTFCTGKVDEETLERAVCEVFNFKPAEIIKQLDLLRPIYRRTTNYGHFGRIDDLDAITWERTDKAEALQRALR